MGDFHVVDGNMKQRMLPFVLNPWAPINTSENYSTAPMQPLYFTFRLNEKTSGGGKGVLGLCPSSYLRYFDLDIKNLLVYKYPANEKKSVSYKELLDVIPGVLIREYIPDTMLDQCINFFRDIFTNLKGSFKTISEDLAKSDLVDTNEELAKTELKNAESESLFKKILNVALWAVKYVTGYSDLNIVTDILTGSGVGSEFPNYKTNAECNKILRFPYLLYYCLQSCTTTGVFELPYLYENGHDVYSSNGDPGWEGEGFRGGFRFGDLLTNFGTLGNFANMLFGNIGISWTPWWDAKAGQGTPFSDFSITFDLFNDNDEKAMTNFVFVNTVIPNNKWIQYALNLHSPHLYDVKVEGFRRMYACSGNFKVNPIGVLREPPKNWLKDLCIRYGNENTNWSAMADNFSKNHIIKIPDAYRITMTFKSLLPDNFNLFIMQYAGNENQIDKYKDKAYSGSAAANAISTAISKLTEGAVKVWKNNEDWSNDRKA